VLYDVLHVVDGFIELVFIELALTQLPVELGKVVLGVVLALVFLVARWSEVLSAAQVPLHTVNQAAGVAIPALGIRNGGGRD
jgi:hypothetical protein